MPVLINHQDRVFFDLNDNFIYTHLTVLLKAIHKKLHQPDQEYPGSICGLTDEIHLPVVMPGEMHGFLLPPGRLLHGLQESQGRFHFQPLHLCHAV